MTYSDKLKDPRWQKKRLQILERDGWKCLECFSESKTLHIHHLHYSKDTDPWDYDDEYFITLCHECHEEITRINREIEKEVLRLYRLKFFFLYQKKDLLNVLCTYEYLPQIITAMSDSIQAESDIHFFIAEGLEKFIQYKETEAKQIN